MALVLTAGFLFAEEESPKEAKPVQLEVGDQAPAFEGQNDEGKTWTSRDSVGKKYVVLYFYPADFTTGCTTQAKLWRDNLNVLAERGVEVVGVSGDSARSHALFKKAWSLNFPLLADEEAKIAKQFGVTIHERAAKLRPRGPDQKPLLDEAGNPLLLERKVTFARWTFLIGKEGKILYKNTRVNPAKDSQQILEFLETLNEPASQASPEERK